MNNLLPLSNQEKRWTHKDSIRVQQEIKNQLKSHAQNNAMIMHKGDCDIFTCQGCDAKEADKIVSEPYEVSTHKPMKCRSKLCKSIAVDYQDLCSLHLESKCSAIYCLEIREQMPEKDDLCLKHYRDFQILFSE